MTDAQSTVLNELLANLETTSDEERAEEAVRAHFAACISAAHDAGKLEWIAMSPAMRVDAEAMAMDVVIRELDAIRDIRNEAFGWFRDRGTLRATLSETLRATDALISDLEARASKTDEPVSRAYYASLRESIDHACDGIPGEPIYGSPLDKLNTLRNIIDQGNATVRDLRAALQSAVDEIRDFEINVSQGGEYVESLVLKSIRETTGIVPKESMGPTRPAERAEPGDRA